MRNGVLYPASGVPVYDASSAWPMAPKHQWLVDALRSDDIGMVHHYLEASLLEATPSCDTMFLSTEGLFNHWWDFSSEVRQALGELLARWKTEVWVWFRDPVSFFQSLYDQELRNPCGPTSDQRIDWPPRSALCERRTVLRLDYAGFLDDVVKTLAVGSIIRPFHYRRSTIADAFGALKLEPPCDNEPRVNAGFGAVGVEMLQVLNRHALDAGRKLEAVRLIRQIDAILGELSGVFDVGEEVKSSIEEMTAQSTERLRRDYDFNLYPENESGGP